MRSVSDDTPRTLQRITHHSQLTTQCPPPSTASPASSPRQRIPARRGRRRSCASWPASPPHRPRAATPRDLRALEWSSIDNASSRDLDQVEVAEEMKDGAIVAAHRDRRRRRARAEGLGDRRARVRERDVGVHRRVGVPDAAREAVHRPHVAERGRGSARRRHRGRARARRHGAAARRLSRASRPTTRSSRTRASARGSRGADPSREKLVADDALEAQLWLQDRAASLLKRVRLAGRRAGVRHRSRRRPWRRTARSSRSP